MNRKSLQYWVRFIEGAPAGAPAAGTGGTSDATGGQGGAPDPTQGAQGAGGTDAGPAGGVEALRADLAGERQARQASEQQFAEFKEQFTAAFAALTGQQPQGADGGEPTVADLMQQIKDLQAQQDERAAEVTNREINSAIRASATALGFHNPDDALPYIDEVETTADGSIDTAWIDAEIKKVAEARPYLLKSTEPTRGWRDRGASDAGIGSRGGQSEPTTPRARIEAGLAQSTARR